jgi:hypothetical protein
LYRVALRAAALLLLFVLCVALDYQLDSLLDVSEFIDYFVVVVTLPAVSASY